MTRCPYCGKEMPAEEFAQHHAECLRPKRLETRIPEVPKEEVKVLKPPEIKPKRLETRIGLNLVRCPYCGKEIPTEEFARHHAECKERRKMSKAETREESEAEESEE